MLFTSQPRGAGNAATAGMLLVILGGAGWGTWRLIDVSGPARWFGWLMLGLLSLVLLRALNRHLEQVGIWLRWRGRPLPAMRLTASGLDYSPAYTGEFEFHVPWGPPMRCAYRRGPDNRGFFWCLYASVIDGPGSLPASIPRTWPLAERSLRSEWRDLVRTFDVDERSPVQAAAVTHLVMYGTPIAINPYLVTGDPFDAADRRLRERTNGRCTLQPPQHPIGPTTRPDIW